MAIKKTSTKTNWKPTDNRFVAFLDILGFKDLVSRNTHNQIYEQLSEISKIKKLLENLDPEVKSSQKIEDAEIYIVSFSDSIVIFSKNDSPNNFKYFLVAVRWLFAKTIENGIPLKGAIAHGEISLNKSEQIYFGQPIIDAYLIEEDVNYLGVVAHNSINKYIYENDKIIENSYINKILFDIKTPLKSGSIEHTNVNWFNKINFGDEVAKKIDVEYKRKIATEIVKKFRLSSSGSPRRYVDNTLDVLNKIME